MVQEILHYTEKQKEDYSLIEESSLFDREWYLQKNHDVAKSGIDPLLHFILFGAFEGRNPSSNFNCRLYAEQNANKLSEGENPLVHYILHKKECEFNPGLLQQFSDSSLKKGIIRLGSFPFFQEKVYATNNQDITTQSDLTPTHHAFCYGFPEGRSVLAKSLIAVELGQAAKSTRPLDTSAKITVNAAKKKHLSQKTIGIYYNTKGNVFIKDLAEDLTNHLKSMGMNATLLDETSSKTNRPEICIFTAPHEFFHVKEGLSWVTDEIITNSFMYNTEQPQTLWFERGLPFILLSKGVIDICAQMAEILGKNLPSCFLTPKITPPKTVLRASDYTHPLIQSLPQKAKQNGVATNPMQKRCIDISFFGGVSRHRERFFTKNAHFLSEFKNFFYYRKIDGPLTTTWRDEPLSRIASHVAFHSKITLNIHRDDYTFFEWHRIAKQAMAGGSIVVSEPCLPHPVFMPNIHYFEEEGRHMPDLIEWLLKDPDGQAKTDEVRTNALNALYNKYTDKFFQNEIINFLVSN